MLKKTTIYSIMALSLTLALSAEVMADITTDQNITDASSSILVNKDNKWTGGKITNGVDSTGGTLTITGNNVTATDYPNYVQDAGWLRINTETVGDVTTYGQFTLRGTGTSAAGAATISNGNVVLEESNLGENTQGNTLIIGQGANILGEVKVELGSGSAIELKGNNGSYSGNGASLILTNNDTWKGKIATTASDGVLLLSNYTNGKDSSTATYVQTTGQIRLTGGSTFNLNNSGDYISGGSVNIGLGVEDTSVNTLIVSVKTSADSGQTIDRLALVNIRKDDTLSLTGGGTVLLNGGGVGVNDTWSGKITVADNAVLTLSGRNSENGDGTYGDVTNGTKTYNQTGGTLELGDSTGASSLTLGSKESVINGTSTVKINKGSTLVFNNGLNTNVAVIKTDNTQGNTLTIGSGSKLTANSGSNIDQNAKVNVNGTLDIPTGSIINLNNMKSNGDYTTSATDANTGDTWNGSINLAGGELNLSSVQKITDGGHNSTYNQTEGTLTLKDGSQLTLVGSVAGGKTNIINGGVVNIGDAGNTKNQISVGSGSEIASSAQVKLYTGNEIVLFGNRGVDSSGKLVPSMTLSNNVESSADLWQGTVHTNNTDGILTLSNFVNSNDDELNPSGAYKNNSLFLTYKQDTGTLNINDNSELYINTDESYIKGGVVNVNSDNWLVISTHTSSGEEALLGEYAKVNLNSGSTLGIVGTGTAILNDNLYPASGTFDKWDGDVIVGYGNDIDTPVLTLKNVTKDFTNPDETGTLTLNSGTVNVYGNANGGSHLTIYDTGNEKFTYNGGKVNVKGNDANTLSTFTTVVTKDGLIENSVPINLQGNAEIKYKMNGHNATIANVVPTGTGPNNTMVQSGHGILNLNAPGADLNMGYNLRVENGATYVNANTMTIGTTYTEGGNTYKYGNLQIGMPGNTTETNFYTNALKNNIYGDMSLYNAWYHTTNPKSTTNIGGNLYTGSGIDMMYGKINSINLAGTTTIDNLKLKIDVDPATYSADTINSTYVRTNPNSKIDLVDYKLLSTPRRDKYTFRVINAKNDNNYSVGAGANKVVSQRKITWTPAGGYQMIPSSVKGAFDMVLIQHNPQAFRGQVAANVIYANQLAISNQLFDRMFYSNLPYFNDDCSNKTAAANTLFSPYQYSNNDTGLWFKPYANFETIRMSYVGNVRNNAYGAMIGADFAKKKWGEWSFIPTAFIGYNGGHTTYHGVGMWHNGGQGGLMGTLTRKNFITSLAVYGGGYHNVMNVGGYTDRNAMWNVGVASKTAYNIHLPWDFILQPTLYMAYNYVGASSFDSDYDGFMHKVDPLNAYSIAPGVNLIWQKETFSIYALFQAMFNINSVASGQMAEIDMPHMGIRDPYFEYGLGVSKFFKDRFSGYGQAVARSGSRKGIGFQLGLNMKL